MQRNLLNVAIDHCKHVFDVLIANLNGKQIPPYPSQLQKHKSPLFVSWYNKKQLRGCIGTFNQQHCISVLLPQYALISALEDPRFSPISKDEIPFLSNQVQFLSDFQQITNPQDWTIGEDGVVLEFEHKERQYSSTFLPEVALEQNWDHMTTFQNLARKAGYFGEIDSLLKNNLSVKMQKYKSSSQKITYDQYKKN